MKLLVETLSIIIALLAGLIVTRELFALLPSWSMESWHLIASDAIVLFTAFSLSTWLAHYMVRDLLDWIFSTARKLIRILCVKLAGKFKKKGKLRNKKVKPDRKYRTQLQFKRSAAKNWRQARKNAPR